MKINVDCFDKYVELQFPTEDRRLSYGEAEELKNKLTNSLENYQKQRKKTEPKIFDDCVHYRENQTHCEKHFYIYNCKGCKFYKTNPIFEKMSKLDKKIEKMNNRLIEVEKHYPKWENIEERTSNLEKVYLMMYDEFDKKLEMLRENNNLFANEIKKVGGFEEDEDDLSPIKEICNAFERVYGKEDDKNEQSIQDIQKRILLKHFIKNWYTDEIDYCDSSTKKCTQNSCLDHYLEYYMENKLWDKIV